MNGAAAWDEDIWVTRVVDYLRTATIDRPLLTSCLSIGAVPAVLSIAFFALTADEMTMRYAVSHSLAMLVCVVGPGAIWYWDSRVFARFVEDVREITADTDELERIAAYYSRVFRRRFWVVAVPWTCLVVTAFLTNFGVFEAVGVDRYADPAFLVFALTAIWWGFITGIGFHIAITAVRFVRAVGHLELRIEPLHPDGLGGLSAIGSFAIWTTMLISIGSLTFPFAFLVSASGGYGSVVYVAIALYVLVIALSFVYPTVYVNRRAQEVREQELERMRARIRQLENQTRDPAEHGSTDEVAKRLEIRRLRDEFQDYATVSLYPLSVGIITRLLTSILLPILFIVFEMWFSQVL